jgi:hypothetical protein
MAKRSSVPLSDKLELGIDPTSQIQYNLVTNKLGSTVIRYGSYSGKRYEWQPGQALPVQREDAQSMRNLKIGERACCAGVEANIIFEVSED